MLLGGQLDKLEQAGRFLLAVDDERTTKNLVAAMLRVDLTETEHLTIGERTANAGTCCATCGRGQDSVLP